MYRQTLLLFPPQAGQIQELYTWFRSLSQLELVDLAKMDRASGRSVLFYATVGAKDTLFIPTGYVMAAKALLSGLF